MSDTFVPPPGPPEPLFIGYARSFWFGILPTLLILLDVMVQLFNLAADATVGPPIAGAIAGLLGADAAKVETTMRALSPLFALVIAQQRAGAARPYSIDPRAK